MRKTSYAITLLAVVATLVLNIVSTLRPDWLVVKSPEVLHTRIELRYGLNQLCELRSVHVPGDHEELSYQSYECRKFPMRVKDRCEKDNSSFCASWTSAGYASELGIGFAALSLVAIAVGVSTGSRRRRIWRAVAGLVLLHAIFQIISFGIVTELYRQSRFPTFESARPGTAYVLNTVSWVFGILTATGVIITGIFADKGHRWAAGNRAYRRIEE